MNARPDGGDGAVEARKRAQLAELLRRRAAAPRPFPASYAQERMWLVEQMQPGLGAYHIVIPVALPIALNVAAFERAVNAVVERHEALRTTFAAAAGEPRQVVWPAGALRVEVQCHDLRGPATAAARRAAARGHIRAATETAFDLERGPLVRAMVLRVGEAAWLAVLTLHHIVADGWSVEVLLRELDAVYGAEVRGERAELEPLPIQYPDYAVWQRQWLQGEERARQLGYWREQLAGAPAVLELPTDHPRPRRATMQGGQVRFALGAAGSAAVQAFSRRAGVTAFMTLVAAFQVLLARYSGQRDIVVGTPIAGRTRVELEGLIGYFANTLVLRTRLEGGPGFAEVVRRVREVALGAYAHQELPFEALVAELGPARHPGYAPLVQVLFSLEQGAGRQRLGRAAGTEQGADEPEAEGLGELAELTREVEREWAKFDLVLVMGERGGQWHGMLEYARDLFEAETAARMAAHYQRLLQGLIAEPRANVYTVGMLSGPEVEQQVAGWNATGRRYPSEAMLDELVAAQVARTPEAVAVVEAGGRRVSYAELAAWSGRLAARLRALGVGRETRVGVVLERGAELVTALLGVVLAGGVYVPLEAGGPARRLAWQLADLGAPVVVTTRQWAGALPAGVARVDIDALPAGAEGAAAGDRAGRRSSDLAYILYTSGSTGTPKGVMVSHRSLCNRMRWGQATWPLTAQDAVLNAAAPTFDVAIWEVLTPLVAGARIVICPPGRHLDLAYLVDLIAGEKVTVAGFVPSLLRHLLDQRGIRTCASLRHVFAGAEPLSAEVCDRFHDRLSAQLHNLYGVTESTIDATWWTCRAGDRGSVPIGRPVGNTQVYVLDAELQLLPVGVPGELCIGGDGLARGYLDQPGLTAERFVPHPYSAVPGARLYRTGDRARYRPDGAVEFLGRVDDQVKIRGARVELGEIEAALKACPGVADAVVLVRGVPGPRAPGAEISVAQLLAYDRNLVAELLDEIERPSEPS